MEFRETGLASDTSVLRDSVRDEGGNGDWGRYGLGKSVVHVNIWFA